MNFLDANLLPCQIEENGCEDVMSENGVSASEELFADPDGVKVEEKLLEFIETLRIDGIQPRVICRALSRVLLIVCERDRAKSGAGHSWGKRFLEAFLTRLNLEVASIQYAEDVFVEEIRLIEGPPAGTA